MAYTTDLVYAIYGKDKTAGKTLKGVGKEADNAGDKFRKMGKVAATSFLALGGAAAAFGASAIKAASDLAETQSKVNVIFGDSSKQIMDFADKAATSIGQSKQQAMDAAANFAIFGKAAGLQGTGLVDFSTNLTKTAADMASFANTTPQEAIDALGSALRGEMEPIRKYGVLLDQETLKNRGTIMGFGEEIGNSLTGGQRVMFATAEIMEQLGKSGSDTLGDFARTSDGLANQQRILEANFKNTKTAIGTQFLPMMTRVATYINDTVVPNVQAFVDGLTGVENKSGDAMTSIYNLGEKTREFFKFLRDNKDFLGSMGKVIAAIFIGVKAYQAVAAMTGALTLLRAAFVRTTAVAATTAGAEAAATGGASLVAALPAIAAIAATFGVLGLLASFTNDAPAGEQTAKDIKKVKSGKPTDFTGSMVTTTGAGAQGGRTVDAYAGNQKTKLYNGLIYTYDPAKKKYYVPDISGGRDYSVQPRAVGGPVSRGASYLVGERGPEIVTMSGNGFVTPNNRLGGMGGTTVNIYVAGSVIHERDLAVTVRDNIAQLMRRRGLNPAILGV